MGKGEYVLCQKQNHIYGRSGSQRTLYGGNRKKCTGLNYGYLFDRFLQKDDFDADGKLKVDANGEQILPKMSLGTPRPGDTLFKDLNGDGVIDGDDKTYFGYARHPEYVFGFLGGFSWKNFEFSMQWTAAMNASRILEGSIGMLSEALTAVCC